MLLARTNTSKSVANLPKADEVLVRLILALELFRVQYGVPIGTHLTVFHHVFDEAQRSGRRPRSDSAHKLSSWRSRMEVMLTLRELIIWSW